MSVTSSGPLGGPLDTLLRLLGGLRDGLEAILGHLEAILSCIGGLEGRLEAILGRPEPP